MPKKICWTINARLPKDTMLAMLRKGILDNLAGKHGESGFRHMDYDRIEIGLAPGGVVVLWLMGGWHRTEVCRLQAQESKMDPRDFMGSTGKDYASPIEYYGEQYICPCPLAFVGFLKTTTNSNSTTHAVVKYFSIMPFLN